MRLYLFIISGFIVAAYGYDGCESLPCFNGGTCTKFDENGNYKCECDDLHHGSHCHLSWPETHPCFARPPCESWQICKPQPANEFACVRKSAVSSGETACKRPPGDQLDCVDTGDLSDANRKDLIHVVGKLQRTIDNDVGVTCRIGIIKWIECEGTVCADAEILDGSCRSRNDLLHTVFNAKGFLECSDAHCHNVRIVSHGGAIASRIRIL